MTVKRATYILFVILLGFTLMLAYLYQKERKETVALQLKLKLLEKEKRTPVAWQRMLKLAQDVGERLESAQSAPAVEAEIETTAQKPAADIAAAKPSIDERTTDILAQEIDVTLKDLPERSYEEINESIDAAEELIRREPDSYSSYKAKLILLLTKEAAHFEEVDDDEVADLLDEMATFDVTSNEQLRKEAFLISRTDARIEGLEARLEVAEEELLDIEIALAIVDEGSEEEKDLLVEQQILEQRIADQSDELEDLEDALEADLLANEELLVEDIVEIPLQRSLAKGEYGAVIDEAEALLDRFGDSIMAYHYLIRALELSGQAEAALDVIANSGLSPAASRDLERRLQRSRQEDPKDYWKRLRF